tara:strand:- start:670 stop:870 length:201 start_codon:yes stop_codon:yes gene_type:complete
MKQIVLYSLLTVMHFDTPEECQMWSDKIYGEGYRCFETYKYEELYLKPPLPRPNNFDKMTENFLSD